MEVFLNSLSLSIQCIVCVRKLESNPYIKRFASGKSRIRVHFESDLDVSTNFENRDPSTPHGRTPVNYLESPVVDKTTNSIISEPTFDENSENHRPLYSPIKPIRSTSELDESWASFLTEETNNNRDPPSTVFVLTPNNHGGERSPHARRSRDPPTYQRLAI